MSTFSIGFVLTKLMKQFNLNALELERHTGVPSSTIYRLLKNKDGNPTVDVLKKLASYFQITISQLIGEEPIGIKQVPLVHATDVLTYLNSSTEKKSKYQTIPIDFVLSPKSFATYVDDDLMEPFILMNSIVIIDPERDFKHKDFILFIKNKQHHTQIRQLIKDGADLYLKALNMDTPTELMKIKRIKDFSFIGVIVHYRTNLFALTPNNKINEPSLAYSS